VEWAGRRSVQCGLAGCGRRDETLQQVQEDGPAAPMSRTPDAESELLIVVCTGSCALTGRMPQGQEIQTLLDDHDRILLSLMRLFLAHGAKDYTAV
jgi:hypothetical protein